ncbi:hypothetical protein H8959_012395 [Pygathrix nigripes]
MYLKPESKKTLNSDDLEATDKIISMFCGVMTPMLNPLIYSLRNKDVKEAVKHLLNRSFFSKRVLGEFFSHRVVESTSEENKDVFEHLPWCLFYSTYRGCGIKQE